MELTGNLSEFSLPEIFQFLEQGYQKGLLTIRTLSAINHQQLQTYYVWLLQGRIVAAADRLDGQGLLSMIEQRGLLSDRVASKIPQICSIDAPLGLCLKTQGLLQAEQLTLLFRTQVIKQVSALLQIKDGKFEFDPTASLPQSEITGLNMPATEVTLMSLRTLQDWSALAEKLPEPTVGLLTTQNSPQLRLESSESQILELANGKETLQNIAKKLGFSVEKVQQIAFRLIVTNLVEEIFLIEGSANSAVADTSVLEDLPKPKAEAFSTPKISKSAVENSREGNNLAQPMANSNHNPNVSRSFLQNLVGFLRNKL